MPGSPLPALSASRLVVRPPNWLGDAVLALPALGAVRQAFAEVSITIAAPEGIAALFREVTDVRPDRILVLDGRRRRAVAQLREGGFDAALLFPNSFRSAWMMRRAGVASRWGFATAGRGWLLTRRSRQPGRARRHQADYYRELVRGLGIACDDLFPRMATSAPSQASADALLEGAGVRRAGPVVGFAPGAAYGQAKQWPPARVAAVIARLARERGVTSVLVGAGHDRDAARAIESWLHDEAPDTSRSIVNLVGRTALGTLAGVLARTDVFVSNDSGAMHLAAALERPVVALFGPTDERATRPLGGHAVIVGRAFCRPCLLRDCPIDHRCMKRITVDQVFDAVATRLPATRVE